MKAQQYRTVRVPRSTSVDFDVGLAELIEQDEFEIEDITLSGEREVSVEVHRVPSVTVSGEHRAVAPADTTCGNDPCDRARRLIRDTIRTPAPR